MKRFSSSLRSGALAATFVTAASLANAASVPNGFNETTLASGLNLPTLMQIAPDGRLFVSERNGRLRVFKNNQLLSAPFLTVPVSTDGERGLLGIAFDRDYASNRYVYIYYTRNSPLENRISRFQASAGNPDVAAGGETVLLRIPHRGNVFHNGGSLQVGNDGKLYAAVGDHQSNDGRGNNLWGKVLRLNTPDGSVPSDNPYLSSPIPDQVWAIGFRNPFGMDIQRTTGRIFVNDVGNSSDTGREEINELRREGNYNWSASEGPGSFYNYRADSQGGCAIVGGDFYNPPTPNFPSQYIGKYFYGDHCGGWIKYINSSGLPGSPVTFLTGLGNNSITDVEVGLDGSLYYSSRAGGVVRRVRFGNATPTPTPRVTPTPTPGGQPPVPVITAPAAGALYSGGQTINFAGSCSDPEDGTRPASALTWEILFHHNTHTHPFFGPTSGITSGSFTVLRDNESEHTVWYRIHLTCVDSRGNSRTVFRDVNPRVVNITLASNPSGLRLQADHAAGPAPLVTQSVVGVNRMLTAPSPQTLGGTRYVFVGWSDGGARVHTIVTPGANITYTATFRAEAGYVEVTPPASAVTASTHDGNVPGNTVDNNLATRWSANGDGQWLRLDLGRSRTVSHVGVAVYNGNSRRNRFEIQVSTNGSSWSSVFSGESSGTSTAEETFDFSDVSARYVRYLGHSNNVNGFNSVTEVSVFAVP
jgi:glucose/arabinose dehydrogenase